VSSGSDKFFRENYKRERETETERERGIYLYFGVSNVRIKRSREYRKLQIEWIRLSIHCFNLPIHLGVLSAWKEKPEIDERDFLPLAVLMRIEFHERVRAHAYIRRRWSYMFILC